MENLPLPDGSADLVWAEGSAHTGWTVAATYLLPDTDWAAYYDPLAARIAQLRQQRPGDGAALDEVGREIEMRRVHRRDYGYTGYVLRPR